MFKMTGPLFLSLFTFCLVIDCSVGNEYYLKKVEELEQRQKQLREGIKNQMRKNEELIRDVEGMDKREKVCINPVGFSARLTTGSTTQAAGNIVFNSVTTDTGNHYNASSGVFTVRLGGNYEFFLTLMSQSGNYYGARIIADGSELCRAYASSNSQAMGTCVTMTTLAEGAEISVQTYTGSKLYGGGYTSFSGHMINN